MWLLIIGSLVILAVQMYSCQAGDDPCFIYQPRSDPRRNQNSTLKPSEPALCDYTLSTRWYRFLGGSGHQLSDSARKPLSGDCTTSMPIFLKDLHPNLTCNEKVTKEACFIYGTQQMCKPVINLEIGIKRCCFGSSKFYIYRLPPPPTCDMAYCTIGEPGLKCPNGYLPYQLNGTEKCKPRYPEMSKDPQVSSIKVEEKEILIYCEISFDNTTDPKSAVFFVQFMLDGVVTQNATADHTNKFRAKFDIWTLQYNLGKHISCRAKGWWREYKASGMHNFLNSSNRVFAGVKVVEYDSQKEVSTILLDRGEESNTTIQLVSTLPIINSSHINFPQVLFNYEINYEIKDDGIGMSDCFGMFSTNETAVQLPIRSKSLKIAAVFTGKNWKGDWPFRYLSFRSLSYKEVSLPFLFKKSIWDGYKIPEIPIRIEEKFTRQCTSNNDPHIITFDGLPYDIMDVGEFVLATLKTKSLSLLFEVRVRHWNCSETKSTPIGCNCGVAARENNDIFIVDICHGNWLVHRHKNYDVPPLIWHRSLSERSEGRAHGAYMFKEQGGKAWRINFPSGAWVRVSDDTSYGLNVKVSVPPFFKGKKMEGICGDFDGNIEENVPRKLKVPGKDRRTYFDPNIDPEEFTQSKSLDNKKYCSCENKKIVCKYNETTKGTDITGNLPTQTKGRHRRSVRTGKDTSDAIIQDISRYSYNFDYNERNDAPAVKPTWPTKSGETEATATEFCIGEIKKSPVYNLCTNVPDFDFDESIKQCVGDIQLTDDRSVSSSLAVENMEVGCLIEARRTKLPPPVARAPNGTANTTNPSGTAAPINFTMEDIEKISKLVCPNKCSGKGTCEDGECRCYPGFTSVDCSVDANRAPEVVDIDVAGICDVRTRRCEAMALRASNIADGTNVSCRFIMHKVDLTSGQRINVVDTYTTFAKLLSYAEMVCPLPKQPIDTPLVETAAVGIPVQSFDLKISNDGHNFSVNSTRVTIFDSHCVNCQNHTCVIKSDACLINGYCFEDGETDPVNEACRACDVRVNNTDWTKMPEPALPCSQCGGLPCICSRTKWKCSCPRGYENDANGLCVDVDECKTHPCSNGVCENTNGSYLCHCSSGYSNHGGKECTDVDECQSSNPCVSTAVCTNTPGSYRCTCKIGFTGENCTDIDECLDKDLCGRYADCVNVEGSYYCISRPSGCPLHFTNLNNRCYLIKTTPLSFSHARDACRNESADLAMIRTIHEYKLLTYIIHKSSGFLWVGVTDVEEELTFKFIDGTDVFYTPSWDIGRPADTPSDADCIAIHPANAYSYVDRPCDQFSGFICQAPWKQPFVPIG